MGLQDVAWGYAAVFVGTLLAVFIFTPLCRALGFLDRPTARKAHGQAVPYSGGLAIGIALLPWVYWVGDAVLPWPALAGLMLLWLLGLVDDAKPLPSVLKFAAQAVGASALVVALRGSIESIGLALLPAGAPEGLIFGLAIFCAIGLINALNMIDGVDGLAGAQVLAVLGALAVFSSGSGGEVLTLAGALGAAVLAYLVFNFPYRWRPMRIFMGDGGALFLGGLLAAIVVLAAGSTASASMDAVAPWTLVYLLSDTMAVIFARLSVGRFPFSPDRWHLHHQLLDAGRSMNQVIALSVVVAFCGGAAGSLLHELGFSPAESFLALLCVVTVYAVAMALRLRRRADSGLLSS